MRQTPLRALSHSNSVGVGERTRLGCIKPAPSPVCLEASAVTKPLDFVPAPEVADEASATAPGGALPVLTESIRLSVKTTADRLAPKPDPGVP